MTAAAPFIFGAVGDTGYTVQEQKTCPLTVMTRWQG